MLILSRFHTLVLHFKQVNTSLEIPNISKRLNNYFFFTEDMFQLTTQQLLVFSNTVVEPPNHRGKGGAVFAGGRQMKIFSTVFRDVGKNVVGERYFQHWTVPEITGKINKKSGLVIIKNGI